MSSITVEMLKERFHFPVENVAPYGACIVVPGDKFDPDWEDQLCAQGHKVVMTSLDGKVVTLVKLEEDKKVDLEAKLKKLEPLAASRVANLQIRVWSEDDAETLLKRMQELPGTVEQKCVQLVKEFKGRSPAAIHQKYVKLQRGLKKQARPKKERKGPVKPERTVTPMSTPMHTPVTLDKLASDVKGILDILDVQSRVVDKLFCALLMRAVEIKEVKGDLSIPPGLWIHYANALLEDDKQYREKFRLKVEQLLEASA